MNSTKAVEEARKVDRKIYKKCIKCREWKPKEDVYDESEETVAEKKAFGKHDSADGYQSICYQCKNAASKENRARNVPARLRHHTATRCREQLGDLLPEKFVEEMDRYLGYTSVAMFKSIRSKLWEREGKDRKLKDALDDGYHIDHIHPLMDYNVIVERADGTKYVDWGEFKRCWSLDNLEAIPAQENLQKGAKIND